MLSRTLVKPSAASARLLPAAVRAIHKGSGELSSESKISSRDSINVSSKENTRSGTNDEIAHNNTAYDPHNTDPQAEKKQTGVEVGTTSSSASSSPFYFSSTEHTHRHAPLASWGHQTSCTEGVGSVQPASFWSRTTEVKRDALFAATAAVTTAEPPSAEDLTMFLGGFWL